MHARLIKKPLGNLQRGFLLETAKALELPNINKAEPHLLTSLKHTFQILKKHWFSAPEIYIIPRSKKKKK